MDASAAIPGEGACGGLGLMLRLPLTRIAPRRDPTPDQVGGRLSPRRGEVKRGGCFARVGPAAGQLTRNLRRRRGCQHLSPAGRGRNGRVSGHSG